VEGTASNLKMRTLVFLAALALCVAFVASACTGKNEKPKEVNGACVCRKGFERWPNKRGDCIQECSHNAKRKKGTGKCACLKGFTGLDPKKLSCKKIRCGKNEELVGGACKCIKGANRINGVCENKCTGTGEKPKRVNGECVCTKRYEKWPNKAGACIKACGHNASRKKGTGKCACNKGFTNLDAKFNCRKIRCGKNERLDGNSCKCLAGYTRKNGKCQSKCGGKDEKTNAQGKCVCRKNYERWPGKKGNCIPICGWNSRRLSSGVCVCLMGYQEMPDGKCRKIRCKKNEWLDGNVCKCKKGTTRQKDGTCDHKCSATNFEKIVKGKCVCIKDYERFPGRKGKCIPKCPWNSTRQKDGTCACDAGFVVQPDGTCKKELGECYHQVTESTLDMGKAQLVDQVIIDNGKHQIKPYDMVAMDVYVSMVPGQAMTKCGTATNTGKKGKHIVDCGGVEAQYVTLTTAGNFLVHCDVKIKGRPTPPPAPGLNDKCTEVGQADIIFVLDQSGSVTAPGYEIEKKFVAGVIRSLRQIRPDGNGIRIGAMAFSFPTHLHWGPVLNTPQEQEDYASDIEAMGYATGGTFTAQALANVQSHLAANGRAGVPKIVVTLTDGVSASEGGTIAAANALRASGAHMLSVGVGSNLRVSELVAMADKPTDKFKFVVNDFKILDTIISKVKKAMFCKPTP